MRINMDAQDEHGCFLFHEELWNPHLTSPMGEGFLTPVG